MELYGATPAKAKRSISEKQLAANRANAQKSTGPVTPEGKARSSVNAFRHGLTGQISVKTAEDRAAHQVFCDAIISDLKPEGALEEQLACSIADQHWRLNRARAIEDDIFALGHYTPAADIDVDNPELHAALTAARVFLESSKQFERLTLYEQRIQRNLQKDAAQLEVIQSRRKLARAEALREAEQLARIDRHNGEDLQSIQQPRNVNGFVFSNEEIADRIQTRERLKQWKFHENNHWNPDVEYPHAA